MVRRSKARSKMNKKNAVLIKLKGGHISKCPECKQYVEGKTLGGVNQIRYYCNTCPKMWSTTKTGGKFPFWKIKKGKVVYDE